MEHIKREKCPVCGCTKLINNVLITEKGEVKVYVECSNCGSFVSRYTLKRYTSNKPYESLLNYYSKRQYDSGRVVLKNLEAFSKEIETEFKKVKETIKSREETKKIEEIIAGLEDN
ncbi:MAG TPA: hypothetical protein ENL19_00290 [candidate division WOR-3 bacterium]|uniref:Uncharacterized protein n=1 Tax=candidate division WOR-3 bacterium TaxID=2052148 RepID=A0A7C5DAE7_UNCW3|nr:hypothetical protein [candidate division WOR-3 bacterium]